MAPLKKGSGKRVVADNVVEMVNAYLQTGKIGNVRPRNLAHARRIALAAAQRCAGEADTAPRAKKRRQ